MWTWILETGKMKTEVKKSKWEDMNVFSSGRKEKKKLVIILVVWSPKSQTNNGYEI
jgi:hypothetical protein